MNEQQMGDLVKMNHRLNNAQQPDVDAEWKTFSEKKFSGDSTEVPDEPSPSASRRPLWHLYVSALVGAAAMFLIIFTFRHQLFPAQTVTPSVEGEVAMVYDENPQQVSIQSEGSKAVDITQRDSISFFPASGDNTLNIKPSTLNQKIQRLSTPRGMDYKVILADGSEVWLNAESRIEFPANFQGNERRVKLLGEAYFKVARNEKSPFIVSTDQMDVKVLGTEFNLKSYANEAAHVTLVKGSVEVGSTKLTPGQDAWYDKEGNLKVVDIDVYDVIQWKDGFFYFNDKSLVTVLRELGRWYNLGVIFRNANAMNHKVHFSALREGTIEEALSSLNGLRKVKITLQGNNIIVE